MKTKCVRVCLLSAAAGGLMLVSGCAVDQNGHLAFVPPTFVVAPVVVAPQPMYVAPALVVEAPVMVPETYVWDGVENVGVVNGQYFYLGAGDVWLVADGDRLERFHGYERDHPDWRDHGIRNDRYRKDAHGHEQPRHDEKGKAAPAKKDEKKKDDQH